MKTIEEAVDYGLDQFDPDRTIEIPLRDALYAYKVLEEYMSFFHQPLHYPDMQSVDKFLGSFKQGALHVLHEAIYEKLYDVWPDDVRKAFDDGTLDIDSSE